MKQVTFGTVKSTTTWDDLRKHTKTTKHQAAKVVSSSLDVEEVIKISSNSEILTTLLAALEDFRTNNDRTELRLRVVKKPNQQATKIYVAYTEVGDS